MSMLTMQDVVGFQIGFGAFLYGRPPAPDNMEIDVAVIVDDHDDIAKIQAWLDVSAAQFQREHGIRVDGLLMTESDWVERQSRIFGTHPHESVFATVETWSGSAYVPIYNESYIREKIGYCRAHPIIEGIKAIDPEMRFGTAVERK